MRNKLEKPTNQDKDKIQNQLFKEFKFSCELNKQLVNQLWNQLFDQLNDQLWDQLYNQLHNVE